MGFDPVRAEVRFGCGLSPKILAPNSVAAVIERLSGPDRVSEQYPISRYENMSGEVSQIRNLASRVRQAKRRGQDVSKLLKTQQGLKQALRFRTLIWMKQSLLRCVWTEDGFRERLVHFWYDHFSAPGKTLLARNLVAPYIESAIRPHLTGKFGDLLLACVTHPHMLDYLDQTPSMGPASDAAVKRRLRGQSAGLNENLAREILELHTMGVSSAYSQGDVRQLAELLTGLTGNATKGFRYLPKRAEPGSEIIMQRIYGADGGLSDIENAMQDIAMEPATAVHISRKLAVHFITDLPSPSLVNAMSARYLETQGDLLRTYTAMLEHPDAWFEGRANYKRPVAFITSAMRALAVSEEIFDDWGRQLFYTNLAKPLQLMGQEWLRPGGPDGWEEEDGHWMSPQGLAARLQWSLAVPSVLVDSLPDPRRFVTSALGTSARPQTVYAVNAAQTRREGLALALMSPEFQRH